MTHPPLSLPPSVTLVEIMSAAVRAHHQGRLDEAQKLYAKALELEQNHFPALYLLGLVRLQRGEARAATEPLAAAVRANPASVDALSNYGVALALCGEHRSALTALNQAVACDPRHAGALMNRGNTLAALGRITEALDSFDRAYSVDPRNPEICNNRGNALSRLGRYDEALASYDRALALKPDYVEALENRGNALIVLNRNAEALASYGRALAIRPDYADAHYAAGFVRLRLGELRDGFKQYEWRWRRMEFAADRRDLAKPLWLGETPLAGRTILLHAEQGLGDTVQFVRYVPLVSNMGAHVVLEVQPALRALLTPLSGADIVISRGEPLPPFDCHCPLLSLPLALATELATIPADIPYIGAPAERVAHWRDRVPQTKPCTVGIVWCGNPSFRNDHNRSMALADVAPLLAIPDVAFVSLNPGLRPDDVAGLATMPNVFHLAGEFRDFADTAAVLAGLDLVITTDTAVAHLAGAMGKPLWILLCCGADWRWFTDRTDCPWYPTAKLFRQQRPGDWASVITRVKRELMTVAHDRAGLGR